MSWELRRFQDEMMERFAGGYAQLGQGTLAVCGPYYYLSRLHSLDGVYDVFVARATLISILHPSDLLASARIAMKARSCGSAGWAAASCCER